MKKLFVAGMIIGLLWYSKYAFHVTEKVINKERIAQVEKLEETVEKLSAELVWFKSHTDAIKSLVTPEVLCLWEEQQLQIEAAKSIEEEHPKAIAKKNIRKTELEIKKAKVDADALAAIRLNESTSSK